MRTQLNNFDIRTNALPRGSRLFVGGKVPYVRPKHEGEIKGKLAIKHAKRLKVRAWKARGGDAMEMVA